MCVMMCQTLEHTVYIYWQNETASIENPPTLSGKDGFD